MHSRIMYAESLVYEVVKHDFPFFVITYGIRVAHDNG
jgi:hypothetical protein